jgi:thiol-disulfide isomerase/thioredoxin
MNIILTVIVFIIFSSVAYYMYKKFFKPSKSFITNNEFNSVNKTKEAELILFYTLWCPHCKTTKESWDALKSNSRYNNNKYVVSFTEIDCDKESAYADSFNIKEYPTIILLKGDKKYIYDANLSEDTLDLFINTIMNE